MTIFFKQLLNLLTQIRKIQHFILAPAVSQHPVWLRFLSLWWASLCFSFLFQWSLLWDMETLDQFFNLKYHQEHLRKKRTSLSNCTICICLLFMKDLHTLGKRKPYPWFDCVFTRFKQKWYEVAFLRKNMFI